MTVKSGASSASKSSFLSKSCSSEHISVSFALKLLMTDEKWHTFNDLLGQIGAGIAFEDVYFGEEYFAGLEDTFDSEFDDGLDLLAFLVDSDLLDFDFVEDVGDHPLGLEEGL